MSALRTLVSAMVLVLGVSTMAVAQDRVTLMLRSGETVNGRFDGVNQGLFYLDVSDTDERKIPLGQIVVVDVGGGATNLPENELREARGGSHVLVTRGGQLVRGQLAGIEGSRVSGNEDPATVVFRAEGGEERRIRMSEVARLYLGNYPGGSSGSTGSSEPPAGSGGAVLTLRGSQQWLDTGLSVREGQVVQISASGQIQVSPNGDDRATPNGHQAGQRTPNAPVPDAPMGALIGRIGNNRPFGIGGNARITMPQAGRLYVGVNDDNVGDNSGQYEVRIAPQFDGGLRNRRRP